MNFVSTDLPGVVIVEPAVYRDERGWFYESFNEPRFTAGLQSLGLPAPRPFIQDNHSCSSAGVLRGLHYQLEPHVQGKLVRVTRGKVWDVAIDLRRSSPYFGCWTGVELSQHNQRQLWIPEGFGHGFLSLEDGTEFLYKTTDVYSKACERAIRWDDPQLAISWPLGGLSPALAEKDAQAVTLAAAQTFD